jgi:malate synthase
MRYARIRAMAFPTAEVRIPSRDADTRSLAEQVLTPDAQAFIARLNREVAETRAGLLEARQERWRDLRAGGTLRFPEETANIRAAEWGVAKAPRDLQVRKVEITGPTDRKMVINALNSGASVYMADFEDANTPTWRNLIEGQQNLTDAIDRTIEFRNPDGKVYKLGRQTATLVVRPRGWHLDEKHFLVDGMPSIGAIFDFGLYMFRNAQLLLERGTGPYFYLPKMESYREARLWNEIFQWTERELQLPRGSIRATVLVEVITLAFEMEEVLYELRDYSSGLNAGRWDYMFSIIKKFAGRSEFILPDRAQVTMTVPFMRAYTELLVKTCHRRGAFALGGMAAFIPNRRDPQVTETALAKVRDDKTREATDGFDGTWVAHPDLVETAMSEFDRILEHRNNQLGRQRPEVSTTEPQLLDVKILGATITEAGLRTNVNVGIQYIASWLRGTGAAAINNLMEDAATAEISRSQVWQWVHHGVKLAEGPTVTRDLVTKVRDEELAKIKKTVGDESYAQGKYDIAASLFNDVALAPDFVEFLTIPGYQRLD